MKLLTKEIIKRLPKLGETEKIPMEDKTFVTKFFTPDAAWTWYVVEGEEQNDGNWLFFGYVQGMESEWGSFDLRSLKSVRGPLGLAVERDRFFKDVPAQKVLSREG